MTQQNRSEVAWVATIGGTVTGWIQELGAVTIS